MPNGWNKLGEALAGIHPARREEIRQKTLQGLARTDSSLAQARMDLEKAKHFSQDSLGGYFLDIDSEDPEAVARAKAGIALSGINYNTLEGGSAKLQEQRFRQAARDAAVEGDHGRANNELWGVASGPVEIPKVSGGMLLSNRLIPGGGDVTVTPIGQSVIDRNAAQGQAAMVRANRPAASGGGRAGAPKLSEIDKLRLQSELKALEPQLQAALDEVARNQGATVGPGVRKLADAQARVAEIQAAQKAIFDKYENAAAGAPGAARAPPRPNEVNGVAVPAGSSPDELGLLTAMNLEFDRTGQPRLTGDEVRNYRETGSVRRPAAADPVTAAEGAISNRLIDRFAESLGGYGGAPAAPVPAAAAAPVRRQARDKKTGELVTFELRNGQWQRVR